MHQTADDDPFYIPIWAAARYVGRSPATIREWARHAKVRSLRGAELRVHFLDVNALDEATPRRNGGRNQHAARACSEWMVDRLHGLNRH
jgi:hypothetical protein